MNPVKCHRSFPHFSEVAALDVKLSMYLNDTLADRNKSAKVVFHGKTVFESCMTRGLATLARSLTERGDPYLKFPVEIPLKT